MKTLLWRIKFTIHGQRRCLIGWRNWWSFSGGYAESFGIEDCPEAGADEEISAMQA